MNIELIQVTSEFLMDKITECCVPLKFEEYVGVLEFLAERIQQRLDFCRGQLSNGVPSQWMRSKERDGS